MTTQDTPLSFWEHLDVLRGVLFRSALVSVVCAVVAFLFKDELFAVVLAPKSSDFITYQWLGRLARLTGGEDMAAFSVTLVNTGLAQQFVIHMKTALAAGLLCASPYVVYQLFGFIAPALYDNERRYAVGIVASSYVMFVVGLLLSYYLVFPLTFRFLGTYQVSQDVANMITLESYMSTLAMMCLTLGVLFELPVVAWLLGRMGIVRAGMMRRYRRHAIVVILVVAAVITPTSDVFTLTVVSLPIWLLYEASIWIVARCGRDERE